MPGRKNPDMSESEKEREYRLMQKRGYGEQVVGEQAEFLDEMGAAAEVRRKRETWTKEQELERSGFDASRSDDTVDH